MKIKTPFFVIEFEFIFVIVCFVCIFSNEIRNMLFSFFICYLFIIFHELSHMFIASIFGKEIEKFKFTVCGVCIEFKKETYLTDGKKKSKVYIRDFLIYIAGPLANIVLAIVFRNHTMLFQVNLCFAIINLFPIEPLDGYHIMSNLLCMMKVSYQLRQIIMNMVSYIGIFFILIIGIFQIMESLNISVFIFFMYIVILKMKSNQHTKNSNKRKMIRC